MQLSAEIRWFWKGPIENSLEKWFHADLGMLSPGGGEERLDEYLYESGQLELGIKKRGSKPGIEIKGLIATLPGPVSIGPFLGSIQLWSKWTANALRLDGLRLLPTHKTRWLRKYEINSNHISEVELDNYEAPKLKSKILPSDGCNVELTKVTVESFQDMWWTFGCEAFGPSLPIVEGNLRLFLATILTKNVPMINAGTDSSYPAWISTLSV